MSVAPGDNAADEALRAIAEPRRRAILRLVARDELAAGQIAAAFDITRTAVSQHLTVLKNAGLLSERRDGTRLYGYAGSASRGSSGSPRSASPPASAGSPGVVPVSPSVLGSSAGWSPV